MHASYQYVPRYKGYYSAATVSSLAQTLCLMSGAYKADGYKTVILVIARNWDWDKLFAPFLTSHAKHFTRPLAWQYKASADPTVCAGARYKDW